jgi:hypothetical protein
VKILEFLEWPLARNLAYRIVERLAGFPVVSEEKNRKLILVKGFLPLASEAIFTRKKALCTFEVSPDWVVRAPTVICHERWLIRKLPEWHANIDGAICFEFSLNWEQELLMMVDRHTHGPAAEYAAAWLVNSTRSLLNRHLFASRNGLTAWPKAWDFWPHGFEKAQQQLLELQSVIEIAQE